MFRQKALVYRNTRWRGKAILLRGIPPQMIAFGSILVFVNILIFLIAGSYTRRINVEGEIATSPRAVNIYSNVQGVVVKQFIHEGYKVKKGDPLYLIDISKSTRNGTVNINQESKIKDQLLRVSNIIVRLEETKKLTLESLLKQKEHYIEAKIKSTGIVRRAEIGVKDTKDNMDNYRDYQLRGLINKDQLTNQVAMYYQQQSNILSLNAQDEQNGLQIATLDSQIQIQSAEFDNRIYQMELEKYELQKELVNVEAAGEAIVRALSDGTVDSLSVTIGQMVNTGDSLLQIIPKTIENYFLVIWVPNDAIPYISIGDKVNIRYEAFPSEKFGLFAATVALVSKTPASSQEMMTYQGSPKNAQATSSVYYKVLVRPEKNIVSYMNKTISLGNGMKGQVTLFLESRKIYQWVFSPFYNMKSSSQGPVND